MAAPGWYPDPAGTPGKFRYWDGRAWSAQTTDGPGGNAQPAFGNDRRGGATWWLILLAALLAIGLIIWLLFGRPGGSGGGMVPEDTNTSTPSGPVWDETSSPSSPPPSQATMKTCPYTQVKANTNQGNDNRLHGGGISVAKINGWQVRSMYLPWVSDFHSQMTDIYPGWVSNIGVGALNSADGFVDPQVSAQQTVMCFSTTDYYSGYTGREELLSEHMDVSGHFAWHLQVNIYVKLSNLPQVKGDRVDVVVVDLGRDYMGIFVSSGTIGDTGRLKLIDQAISTLRVD